MKLKAILFDLDGTLLDSVAAILGASQDACCALGIPYDEDQFRNWIGIPLTVQARLLSGDREDEFLETYKTVYRQYRTESTTLFDGTIEMLDRLHSMGLRTGLVTSKNVPGTVRVLETSMLEGKFEVVITADDVVNPKPDAEPILKGLESLGVSADESVYVGDSLFDHESAVAAGVRMIAVSWGARSKEDLLKAKPEAVFDDWDEFLAWVEPRAGNAPTGG